MSPAVTVTAVEAAAVEATTVTAAVAAVSSAPHERIQGFAPNFSNFPNCQAQKRPGIMMLCPGRGEQAAPDVSWA